MKHLARLAVFVVASSPVAALAQDPELPSAEVVPQAVEAPPPPAATPQQVVTNEAPPPLPAATPRTDFIRIGAGVRIGYVANEGLDAYASNDVVPQFSLDATITLLHAGKLSLAAGLGGDVGGRSSGLRGLDSSLTAYRFSVPIEGRYHARPWLYGFVRLAPGASLFHASLADSSSQTNLTDSAWAFSADASLGASILLGPRSDLEKRTARFWITPEIGYAFATSANLHPNPNRDDKDVLGSDESTSTKPLALNGPFWRLSLATTF